MQKFGGKYRRAPAAAEKCTEMFRKAGQFCTDAANPAERVFDSDCAVSDRMKNRRVLRKKALDFFAGIQYNKTIIRKRFRVSAKGVIL